ncbi:M20/M25/M40 family metallo-hydrolase [Chryseolinea lacunae]|uniref:M20/M25/M40 family metallo-hydrolase n=1 Tax=Chryseolinea lacunae TaxID=2801331 RepID=A0ABS1L0C6_9BACT|nr:M20/M25/M40 family metallo-hydrolase [Chryseolinea lacunae]MBL0745154.1 M20/M25/M40 family metallo-hydrolase [Chryseolinea lacunae]
MKKLLFVLCSIGWCTTSAQKLTIEKLDALADVHARNSFAELYELLSLPNDAHMPGDIEKNVRWCESAFAKRGFTTKRLNTSTVPLLLAERKSRQAKKTVLVYLQIDGQPVKASQWEQESPWKPTLKTKDAQGNWKEIPYEKLNGSYERDWRIFARSTADAKGPAAAFLAALDALKALKTESNFNLKVIMDFEEELGSPHLPNAVTEYKSDLAADMLIIFDGPQHIRNEPTLSFGARGICDITLTTFGPRVPQHSGHYGNYAPNPALRLSQLLASMKDDDGRVTIPGFYDGVVLSDDEKKILARVPDNEDEIKQKLGIATTDKVGNSYQESIQYPSLNIRGLDALFVGEEARTLIPAKAVAELDLRLVPGSDPVRLINLVRNHVKAQGYYFVKTEPTDEERQQYPKIASFNAAVSYEAFQTPFDSECGVWLSKAMVKAYGKEPIKIRMAGGSIPISPFVVTLNIPAVAVPTVNPDNNQHAENENIRVGNYVDAVKTFLAILTEKL